MVAWAAAIPAMISGGGTISSFLGGRKAKKSAKKKERRYMAEMERLYGQEMARYEPGGPFEQRGLRGIAEAKVSATGAGMQRLIGAGQTGGMLGANLESIFEKGVGVPARLSLEDIRTQRLSEIYREKAARMGDLAAQARALGLEAGRAAPDWTQLATAGADIWGGLGGMKGIGNILGGRRKPRYNIPDYQWGWETGAY